MSFQFTLISLYFKLTSLEFNKENIQNLWMGQNLISTLMDTTLRLEGVANNIQHLNSFQWFFMILITAKLCRDSACVGESGIFQFLCISHTRFYVSESVT